MKKFGKHSVEQHTPTEKSDLKIDKSKLTSSSKTNASNETKRISETSQESVPEKQPHLRRKRDLPAIYQREQVRYSFC